MIVKTITCHNVYNYGASLQAYALQSFLKESGFDNEIVDYNPWYLYDRYQFFDIGNKKWAKNIITKTIYLTLKMPIKLDFFQRKKLFDSFTNDYLILTHERYFNHQELSESNTDVLICGSDQIWNPIFENGKDAAFFGCYISHKYLMSYAASLGCDTIPNELESHYKEKLSKFDAVSVREKGAKEEFERLGIDDVEVSIDPVFLLSKKQWLQSFDLKEKKEDYILFYAFEYTEDMKNIVQYASKKTGLPIYSCNTYKCSFADKSFNHSGPKEFLDLVLNASLVITNSFHGIAFSVIFNKNFWALKRAALNSRITELLTLSGQLNRQLDAKNYLSINFTESINYESAKDELISRINKSKEYLIKHLNEAENCATIK